MVDVDVPKGRKANTNVVHREPASKLGFTGVLLKSQVQKAIHILRYIANNVVGIVGERDEKDLTKY